MKEKKKVYPKVLKASIEQKSDVIYKKAETRI